MNYIFKTLKITLISFAILAMSFSNYVNAQERHNKHCTKEEIRTQKIAFYTQTLDLTPKEAEKFWPLYNEYWNKLEKARRQTMISLRNLNNALKAEPEKTDSAINDLVEDHLNKKKYEESLTPDFYMEIQKIIPIKKAAKIFQAEENFRIMLIRQLRRSNKPIN